MAYSLAYRSEGQFDKSDDDLWSDLDKMLENSHPRDEGREGTKKEDRVAISPDPSRSPEGSVTTIDEWQEKKEQQLHGSVKLEQSKDKGAENLISAFSFPLKYASYGKTALCQGKLLGAKPKVLTNPSRPSDVIRQRYEELEPAGVSLQQTGLRMSDSRNNLHKLVVNSHQFTFQKIMNEIPRCDKIFDADLFMFMLAVYRIFKMDLFPAEAILMCALSKTSGELNQFLLSLVSTTSDWVRICQLLLERFSSPFGYRELHSRFVMRAQYKYEGALEFVDAITDAYVVFYGCKEEQNILDLVMSGINPQIGFDIFRYSTPLNLGDLRNQISEYLKVQRSVYVYENLQQQVPKTERSRHIEFKGTFDTPLEHNYLEKKSVPYKTRRFQGSRVSAGNLNKGYSGHGKLNINTKVSESSEPVAVFAKAEIFHRSIEVSFDTCSSISMIDRKLLNELEATFRVKKYKKNFYGVGVNSATVNLKEAVDLYVFLKGRRFASTLFIADNLCSNILFGLNWLQTYECVIDIKKKQLFLNSSKLSIPIYFKEKQNFGKTETFSFSPFTSSDTGVVDWLVGAEAGKQKQQQQQQRKGEGDKMLQSSGPRDAVLPSCPDVIHVNVGKEPLLEISEDLSKQYPCLPQALERLVSEFPIVFSDKIGRIKNYSLDISVKEGGPICRKPFKLSRADREEMDQIIDDWESQGIIKKSDSHWGSPAFLVRSPNKSSRLVVDYSQVNPYIDCKGGYIPNMEDVVTYLADGCIYSVLDVKSSYLTLSLSERSKPVTAFVTHRGVYSFEVIPFGIKCGGFALAEVMSDMLYELRKEGVISYFDDVVIVSKDPQKHLETLKKVLTIFQDRGVTLSLNKCQFLRTSISFLGLKIENGKMCIDPKRIESIQGIPSPKTRKGLMRLLGTLQFIAKWIPDYQDVVRPLTRLRSHKVKFVWDNECQHALDLIKRLVCEHAVLKLPQLDKKFVVYSDSSKWSLGGQILQRDADGDLQPVSYFSRKIREQDLSKPIYFLELQAVVECCERFRHYLHRKFELWIDNRSLVWCLSCPKRMAKYGNLLHRLMEFDFEVKFLPSYRNITADFLSRMYNHYDYDMENSPLGKQERDKNLACLNLWNLPWLSKSIKEYQILDSDLKAIIQKLKSKEPVKDYLLVNDILCKTTRARVNPVKICMPKELTQHVIAYYHSSQYGGHVGFLKTIRAIGARYTWNKMAEEVGNYVTSCVSCQLSKRKNEPVQGLLESKIDSIINGHWYIDVVGKLTRSRKGFAFALIIVDSASKMVTLEPMRNLSSKIIIEKLEKLMLRRGFPYLISCDNASVFTSSLFKEFLFCRGIKCARISPFHASANIAERYIAVFKDSIKIFCNGDQMSWSDHLMNVEFSINRAINSETKFSPFELNYRYDVNDPLDVIWELDLVRDSSNKSDLLAKAFDNMKKSWERRKRLYDRHRIATGYGVKDKVLIRKHTKSSLIDKYNKSLDFKFEGPFEITRELTPNSFLVQKIDDSNIVKKVHVTDMKRFREKRNV